MLCYYFGASYIFRSFIKVMKKLIFAVVLVVVSVSGALSAFGQKQLSKEDMFKAMAALTKTQKPEDTEKAYVMAKEYVARFGKEKDKDGTVAKISSFVDKYREHLFFEAVNAHKYADIFTLGKEVLAVQPDNIDVLLNMAYEGYSSVGPTQNKTYVDDSIVYAKKAIQLLDGGGAPKSFVPFKDKADAEAFMYFVAGNLTFERDMKEAAATVYKAVQFESSIKSAALPYYLIASYYEDVYAKLSTDLKTKVDAKTISDADQKTALAKITKTIDLMMDAYARTVTRAEAEKNPDLAAWNERLVQIYKFEKKTDLGLKEFIAAANAKPMPDPSAFQ